MGLMNGISSAANHGAELYARGALEDQRAEIQAKRDARVAALQEEAGIRTEDRAVARADQQRTAQTSRIDAAAGSIAEKAVEPKRGLINSRIEDKSTWTPEQQAAVDQSLAGDKAKVAADPKTRTQAAIATGDISPKDAATMDSRAEIAQMKNDAYLANVQAKLDMAGDKLDMAKTIAMIRAASGGGSDGKDPANAKMIEYLVKNGTPREQATTMVLGDGAGKTKDPVGMAVSLSTAMLARGVSLPPELRKKGVTEAEYAMDIASQQIEAATKKLRAPDSAAPANPGATPKPASATGTPAPAKTRPPLSAFQK